MGLGGGTFISQNKILPGAYVNFVSAARASTELSDRGIATIPLALDWGSLGEVVEVSAAEFRERSLMLFGYGYDDEKLKCLRDLFRNTRTAYLYRLGSDGRVASNEYATARHAGARGNDLCVVIATNPDDASKKDVMLYLDAALVDRQTVASAGELAGNGYVAWDPEAGLQDTAGSRLSGGSSPDITIADYQAYLDKIESYAFNAIGCPAGDQNLKGLFAAFTRRMRDEQGMKFQCVLYNPEACSDYEGIVDVLNKAGGGEGAGAGAGGDGQGGADAWGLVYWTVGVVAGTAVNASATNKAYDGEYVPDTGYTQSQLESAIKAGKFTFHRVGGDIRVLSDINSLVGTTEAKGAEFKENQTIRVIDEIANNIAVLFNKKYIGAIANDADGRISLWSDIVAMHERLQAVRAIEGFSSGDVEVLPGEAKRAVVVNGLVTPVNAMSQLYMTVRVN